MAYNKETGMYEGYLYVIENLINHKKYIGQTTSTIEKRWIKHRSLAKKEQKYYIHKAIHKYGEDNFIINELLFIACEEKEDLKNHLNYLEKFYIEKYKTDDCKYGYNLTSGGEQTGAKNRVSIVQYDLYGNILKEWDSMADAAEFYNTHKESIWAACNGKTMSCNNFVWRYKDDSFYKYPIGAFTKNRIQHTQNVKQYNYHGELLNTYSHEDILNIYGKTGKYNVYEVCEGYKEYYKDFIWRYEEDAFDKYPINSLLIKIENRKNKDVCRKKYKNTKVNNVVKQPKLKSVKEIDIQPKENTGRFKTKLVNCYGVDYNFVKTYFSLTEAGNDVGLKNSYNITNVCNKKRNFAGGYRWYYASDPDQPDKTKIIN